MLIDPFVRMTRDLEMRDWLAQMLNFMTLSRAHEDDYVSIASSYLGGDALRFFTHEIAVTRTNQWFFTTTHTGIASSILVKLALHNLCEKLEKVSLQDIEDVQDVEGRP